MVEHGGEDAWLVWTGGQAVTVEVVGQGECHLGADVSDLEFAHH